MGTAEERPKPRVGKKYQAVIPVLREGTELSAEVKLSSWSSPIDKYSFLLALYLFGKNLSLVKRFVGSKSMIEIQDFYYGEFYPSVEHKTWSDWTKDRGKYKRFMHGEELFQKCRVQELSSRLLSPHPPASKDFQDELKETTELFLERKISFVDYIFRLKDAVGLLILIEAIGTGREGRTELLSSDFEEKSTEVDTSSLDGAERTKMTETRSFPVQLGMPKIGDPSFSHGKPSCKSSSSHEKSSCRTGIISDDDDFQCQSKFPSQKEGLETQVYPQNSSSTISLEKGGSSGQSEVSVVNKDSLKTEPRSAGLIWIDLNICLYESPQMETDQPFNVDTMQNIDASTENKSSVVQHQQVEVPEVGVAEQQQPINVNIQRRSERSRTLTKKAWEALESDFSETKRGRRG